MNKIRTNLIAFTEDDSFPLKKEHNKKWQFTKQLDETVNKKHLLTIGLTLSKEDKRMRISSVYIAKLGKSDNITTDVLIKVCVAMDCHLDDIMETVDDDK